MIPASFSAIRGITAKGSWPGSDSRHDDPCPLVTLRGYPAGGSPNQREPSRERSVLLISANLTSFHFHDLRHTGNILASCAAGASLRTNGTHGPQHHPRRTHLPHAARAADQPGPRTASTRG